MTPEGINRPLLVNGHGTGTMKTFACSPFGHQMPTRGQRYNIQARGENDQFAMEWIAVCTFSGNTSEFTGV